jgi:RimJ/RimL family protein N-acetyltransferase
MRLVKKTVDSRGEELVLYASHKMGQCPAMSLFLKTYAEIIDKGFAYPNITWTNTDRVIWAQKDSKIVGGISYQYTPDNKMGWIVLSFVDPEQRGRGIYQTMHDVLEKDIIASGGDRISSLVHVDNESRLASAKKVGMVPEFYRMLKKLP